MNPARAATRVYNGRTLSGEKHCKDNVAHRIDLCLKMEERRFLHCWGICRTCVTAGPSTGIVVFLHESKLKVRSNCSEMQPKPGRISKYLKETFHQIIHNLTPLLHSTSTPEQFDNNRGCESD